MISRTKKNTVVPVPIHWRRCRFKVILKEYLGSMQPLNHSQKVTESVGWCSVPKKWENTKILLMEETLQQFIGSLCNYLLRFKRNIPSGWEWDFLNQQQFQFFPSCDCAKKTKSSWESSHGSVPNSMWASSHKGRSGPWHHRDVRRREIDGHLFHLAAKRCCFLKKISGYFMLSKSTTIRLSCKNNRLTLHVQKLQLKKKRKYCN